MEANVLIFALISLAGSVVYIAVVAALHVLPTGYNPVHNAVSDYGVGRYAPLFRVSLWAGSIAVAALPIGLSLGVGVPPLATSDVVFLGLVAVSRVGESLFPTTVEGERLNRTGALHYVFAIVTFGFTYTAISGLTPVLVKLHPWHSDKGLLTWLAGRLWSGSSSSSPRCSRGCAASSACADDSSCSSDTHGSYWWLSNWPSRQRRTPAATMPRYRSSSSGASA